MKFAVVIAAGGRSRRFGGEQAGGSGPDGGGGGQKLDALIGGRAVLLRSVDLFVSRGDVGEVIVATNPDAIEEFKAHWGAQLSFMGVRVVPGGRRERWETVRNALGHVPAGCTHVAVHDGARPLASKRLIDRLFEAAHDHSAVVPVVPVSSTLKRVDPGALGGGGADPLDDILGSRSGHARPVGGVVETVDREGVYLAQTPQVFEKGLLRRAYEGLAGGEIDTVGVTDDAGVVQALGEPVAAIEGETTNLKITYPEDLELAAAIVATREQATAASLAKKRLFADEDDD